MVKITLKIKNSLYLEFRIVNELGWCRIVLIRDENEIVLGAQMFDTTYRAFESVLNFHDFPETNSEFEDKRYVMFLTLNETYCSCYAHKENSMLELIFYAKNEVVMKIYLNKEKCDLLSSKLKSISEGKL